MKGRSLTDDETNLLNQILSRFRRDASWPTTRELQRAFFPLGKDVEKLLAGLPAGLVLGRDGATTEQIRLTAEGLRALNASAEIRLLLDAVELAVERYGAQTLEFSTADLRARFGMSELEIRKCDNLLQVEHFIALPSQRSNDQGPFMWKVNEDVVWHFAGVNHSIDRYLEVKRQILSDAARSPAPPFQLLAPYGLWPLSNGAIPPSSFAPGAPMRSVFVAYPWNAYQDREAYRRSYRSLESELGTEFVFAEDRLTERHILEKVEELIMQTDAGIYDVSGWNPNVALEYGLARGAKRRAFIAFNPAVGHSSDVPADIRGFDRIQYSTLDDLTAGVRRLIQQNALRE